MDASFFLACSLTNHRNHAIGSTFGHPPVLLSPRAWWSIISRFLLRHRNVLEGGGSASDFRVIYIHLISSYPDSIVTNPWGLVY